MSPARRDCTRYVARILVQDPLQEEISAMANAVTEILMLWRQRNQNELPDAIIMFRDGISEGQFVATMDLEVAAINDVSGLLHVVACVWCGFTSKWCR